MIAVCVVEPERDSGVSRGQVVDMEEREGDRIARLEANVGHIQSDVADLKVELRRTNDKIDKLSTDLVGRIDGVEKRLDGKIDSVAEKLGDKIAALKDGLASFKVWAISLYTAQAAALLFVMAKGFKWL
jgi:hypothetical protein